MGENMNYNELINQIEPSRATVLLKRTKEMMKVDPEILNMTAGEPDFDAPEAVIEEITNQLRMGNTHYSDSLGNLDLRERLSKKLKEENGACYSSENILVTPGAKYAVYLSIRALVNPGDEVMWLTPGWLSYPAIVTASGGIPVAVKLQFENNFKVTLEALEAAVTERTKALIINSPNNPTGYVFNREEMDIIAAFLRNHPDVYVISDEIYEKIIYAGNEAISIASYPDLTERTIIINGFSKCSAMTGFRIGYLACAPDLYKTILKLFQHTISCTASFIQKGALKAMDCTEEMEAMRREYEARKDILCKGIDKIDGVSINTPGGAFYAWIKFDTDKDSETVCSELLDYAKISGIPGVAFGEEDDTCVRFSYAADRATIEEMVKRLEKYCKEKL